MQGVPEELCFFLYAFVITSKRSVANKVKSYKLATFWVPIKAI